MPYIKKVEVNGFKTFGAKTTLLLDKGFTTITGPNGSGKTNIIDAVLFGLGEPSSRRLRASNFSSLIFNGGSDTNIKKKKAKVVVQFDNSDGRLPTETSTATVSREIDENGESVYRLNGRRVSKAYVTEVLSMAGISPHGHNIVLQGTLTRMAEISLRERRKIIEDMIGIAQYDEEKAEADEKLKSANIAIKTALGQVGEVQRRLESLERERNDLLRHNFIQSEIRRLEAVKLSQEIKDTQERTSRITLDKEKLEGKVKEIAEQRQNLRSRRRELETEWRRLGFEEVEGSQARVFDIQIEIGELRSRLSELDTKIDAGKDSMDRLLKAKDNLSQQVESLNREIEESKSRIVQLTSEQESPLKEIAEKQSIYDSLYSQATQARSELKGIAEKIRENEEQLDRLRQEAITLRSDHARSQSRTSVYSQRLKDIEEKRADLQSSLESLQESVGRLQGIQNEQAERLGNLQNVLERRTKRKKILELEIKEAGRIAEIAREAIVEFEAQKELVAKVKTEEAALEHIGELGRLGLIPGIFGPLKDLIDIQRGYERAVEAAAGGWLESLVVKDLDVAFTCVETLRQLKLGRIKIIPLQGLAPKNQDKLPQVEGMKAKVSAFVKHSGEYESAVSFVLGDTLLASDAKTALAASQTGYRSVTLDGDLYEAGGGVESGFYRTPMDFSSFVPSESALKTLDKAVTALRSHLGRRETEIGEIEEEIARTREEITKSAEALAKLDGEIERVQKSILQAELNVKRAEENMAGFRSVLEEERAQTEHYETMKDEVSRKEDMLQKELASLKSGADLSTLQERESQREALGNEIVGLRKKASDIETEIATLQSKVKNVLEGGLGNAAFQLERVSKQISVTQGEIEDSAKAREEIQKRIEELEKAKKELSSSLLNAKEDAKKFTSQIDGIDNQLRTIETEYERTDGVLDELRLNLQTVRLQMNRHIEQLRDLGYEQPLAVSPRQAEEAEESLELTRFELERIGAINQLAESQYEEQISRYRELSVRMNELESEKLAIEDFIEEIEQKKYDAFMAAFNQINERIDKYFSKLTGGGNAALKLESPEDPFAGGVDMVVQFVNKPPMIISGASSGERSVAAVAFLFALQEFTPASFYLFDEIDAHLDAFHVERLGELLAEEAAKSQFLVVTLKPEMVSKADRIYGVYGRDGASRVVSTTFKGAPE